MPALFPSTGISMDSKKTEVWELRQGIWNGTSGSVPALGKGLEMDHWGWD